METPVLVVGAGPTGLVLALWLARSGIPFRIIEKNSGPGQASRAMAVQARTLEFYRQLKIADRIIASGIQIDALSLRKGAREIAGFPFRNIGEDISRFQFVLSLPQDDHEHLLVKILDEAGVHIEWNTQLVKFKDEGNRVSATLRKDNAEETGEFAYICGCDGIHSTVRQTLGLNFPGGTYEQIFYVADVQATGLALNQNVNASFSSRTFCLAFPVRSSGMFRLIGIVPMELNGREHVTFDDIRPHVKKQIDVDVGKVNWFSTYHVHHRVADHFRQGRAFIAGDAGHVHSPAGGQGMNTGIGDAVNLAWKLAAVIRGRANESILDTYEPERIAFARALVSTTDKIFESVVGPSFKSKMIRTVFIPIIAPLLLRFRTVRRAQFRLVSQTRIHYLHSPLSKGGAGQIQAGDRLPWLQGRGGQGGQDNFSALNSLDWQIHVYGNPTDVLRDFSTRQGLPIHSFDWNEQAETAGFARDAIYLIRPDGYVALAQADQDVEQLERYLSEWIRPFSRQYYDKTGPKT